MSIGTMLFNPFNGKPRHPADIASDPKGVLVWDGEEPLRAYSPSVEERYRVVLDYAAEHMSSDWPERCQEIVRRARAALSK